MNKPMTIWVLNVECAPIEVYADYDNALKNFLDYARIDSLEEAREVWGDSLEEAEDEFGPVIYLDDFGTLRKLPIL